MGPKTEAYYKKQKEKEFKKKAKDRQLGEQAAAPNVEALQDGEKFAIRSALSAVGRREVPVDADGDCLFHAVLHQAQAFPDAVRTTVDLPASPAQLRSAVAAHITSHVDDYLPFIPQPDGEATDPTVTLRKYCADLSDPSHWGTMLEARACAEIYGVPLYVIAAHGIEVVNGTPGSSEKIDSVPTNAWCVVFWQHLYVLGGHYNATAV